MIPSSRETCGSGAYPDRRGAFQSAKWTAGKRDIGDVAYEDRGRTPNTSPMVALAALTAVGRLLAGAAQLSIQAAHVLQELEGQFGTHPLNNS